MRVLGLDTATEDTAVAVLDGDDVVYDEVAGPDEGRPRHGPALLPMIERAVAQAGGWPSIDRIAVGLGPGSFTGLRVGIATAKGLAHSADVEIVGVPSLDALAAGIADVYPSSPIIAAIDARRGQLFAARYASLGDKANPTQPARREGPRVCDPDEVARLTASAEPDPPPIACGSGALRFRDQFEAAGVMVPGATDPAHTVSGRWIARIGGMAREPVEPIYLRAPDAQRWLERANTEKDGPRAGNS